MRPLSDPVPPSSEEQALGLLVTVARERRGRVRVRREGRENFIVRGRFVDCLFGWLVEVEGERARQGKMTSNPKECLARSSTSLSRIEVV